MLLSAKKLCGPVCKLRAGSPNSSATDVTCHVCPAPTWGKSHARNLGYNLV